MPQNKIKSGCSDPRINQLLSTIIQEKNKRDVRLSALKRLQMRGKVYTKCAIPKLIGLMGDEDGYVRGEAEKILKWYDVHAVPELFGRYTRSTYFAAATVIIRIGSPAVPYLISILQRGAPAQKKDALYLLFRLGKKAKMAVTEAIKLLADTSLYRDAGRALGVIYASADLRPLMSLLKDPRRQVKSGIAIALGKLKPKSVAVVDSLRRLLSDNHWRVRSDAAYAIARIGIRNRALVKDLIRLARDDKVARVRSEALYALGEIHADDVDTLSILLSSLKDQNADIRHSAVIALRTLVPCHECRAVEMVLKQIKTIAQRDPDYHVAESALFGIKEMVKYLKEKKCRSRN